MKKNTIAEELLKWYYKNQRELPWRADKNPYKIWLSEVILQQTRVEQGLPYYLKFVKNYPNIHALAKAPEDNVLRTWQGLGYYSRARNLHKCAKFIVNNFGGNFPSERNELLNLPGIGPYTAAAIASFAFGKKEAVVDGNVIRVITRLYGIEDDIAKQKTTNQVKSIVDELIPESHPAVFNQAIMDFGALHCMPRNPLCANCSFLGICETQAKGIQDKIPFKSKKIKKRTRYFNYLIIRIGKNILMRKRTMNDIWKGLFEFFLIESDSESSFDDIPLPDGIIRQSHKWEIQEEFKSKKHLLSHQTIMGKFYIIQTSNDFMFNPMDWPDYQLYSNEEIIELPKSILIDRFLGEKII